MKEVIVTADDFGLSEAVNDAVERAHRDGILTAASLMVAAPAAADAVRRARAMPALRTGLHVVVVEGPSRLPLEQIPDLVRPGRDPGKGPHFPADQLALGFRYAFNPPARRQLAAEIRAQFAAFAATGLPLDHVNAHKHMHLHPTVGRLLIEIGREYGLTAMRIPAEPADVLRRAGETVGLGARALNAWTGQLRRRARRAGITVTDHCFGIAWSGHMTAARLARLALCLPDGVSEIYTHPASRRDSRLCALMPDYEHEAELAALTDQTVRAAFATSGARLTTFSDLVREGAT
ncbi:MAG: hopanoid biosynthesis-associated protein HpnK [Acetobacteraceae bacterium]|nr:hopanoid biosynthesis-associated protein HpnK [Acetobacteraceae bacterium]